LEQLESTIKGLKAQIQELNEDKTQLEKEKENLMTSNDTVFILILLLFWFPKLNSEIEKMKEENQNLTGEMETFNTKIKEVEDEKEQLKATNLEVIIKIILILNEFSLILNEMNILKKPRS